MHPMLVRQLRRALALPGESQALAAFGELARFLLRHQAPPPLQRLAQGLGDLASQVDHAYQQFERDLALRTRSLELSSSEMLESNEALRRSLAARDAAIAELVTLARDLQATLPTGPLPADGAVETLPGVIGVIRELLERQQAHQTELRAVYAALANQKAALDEHAIVSITDLAGRITYANDRFVAISGYSRTELIGASHRIVKSDHHPRSFYAELWSTIRSGGVWRGEIRNRSKDGRTYWVSSTIVPLADADGRPAQYISIRTDITARKQAEEELQAARDRAEAANRALEEANRELRWIASTDGLTGVWNRRHFEDAVDMEMARVMRYGKPLALLLLDIDHFKGINDAHGHQAGDRVLVHLCQRLQRNLRVMDVLARWGGEEFVILLPHCDIGAAVQLAGKLRLLISAEPFPTVGSVTASFGLAEFHPPESRDAWLRRADTALYAAKAHGRDRVYLGEGATPTLISPLPAVAAGGGDDGGGGPR